MGMYDFVIHSRLEPTAAANLYFQRLNDGEIGAALGVDKNAVRAWRKEHNLPPNRRGRHLKQSTTTPQTGVHIHECALPRMLAEKYNAKLKRDKKAKNKPDYTQIELLHGLGYSDGAIAFELDIDSRTVEHWRQAKGVSEGGKVTLAMVKRQWRHTRIVAAEQGEPDKDPESLYHNAALLEAFFGKQF